MVFGNSIYLGFLFFDLKKAKVEIEKNQLKECEMVKLRCTNLSAFFFAENPLLERLSFSQILGKDVY